MIITYFLLVPISICGAQLFSKKQTVMILEKFDNCPEYNNYTSEIRHFVSKIDHGNVIMSYETHILKDSRGLLEQTVMILEKFDNCPDYNNYTSEIRNFNSKIDHGNVIMNYETHVLKDSRGLLEFVWEIQRCSNRENLNSCIMFNKMRTNKFCNIIESTGDAWSPFMSCVQPRMTCPLKKGVYAGKNCTIDAAAFKIVPLAGAYWRFRAKVMERKIITRMCVDLFGYVRDM